MISKACATMRTAISFLPLLRPFIIKLHAIEMYLAHLRRVLYRADAPIHQAFDDGHLRLLELLLRVTAGRVREVDGMTDLYVVR